MKLPWDKNYLKIAFHVVVTILAVYILGLLVTNIHMAFTTAGQFFSTFVSVMGPLLTALVFAYLVDPAVRFFDKSVGRWIAVQNGSGPYHKRLVGTLCTYLALALVLFFSGRAIAAKIGGTDINKIAQSINESIQGFGDMLVLLNVRLAEMGVLENVDVFLQNIIDSAVHFAQTSIYNVANSFTRAGGWMLNLGIGLTVAFYLLMEKERILFHMKEGVSVFLSPRKADAVLGICHDINGVFSGYIGGQILDAIIVAILISITFSVLGIPYPLVIGAISGFSNLIPYVGAIVAFILSVSVGLLSGTPVKALYAAIAVLILQQIDGMFIVPRVVGKSVELHPVLVILSLSVFGSLFGIFGMVVAVPVTAAAKLFLLRYYQKKKAQGRTGR